LKLVPLARSVAALGRLMLCMLPLALSAEPTVVVAPSGDARPDNSLLFVLEMPPLGLPPIPQPFANPIRPLPAQLGRKLFFDPRLSFNNTISCATCHVPEQGFSSNELAVPVGIEGRSGRRNAPTLYNVAYLQVLFHDGREISLETLIIGPLTNRAEMGNPSIGHVLRTIQELDDYNGRFEEAFEGRTLTLDTLGMAFASYLRLLVSGNSAFDRWLFGGETGALDETALLGFRIFSGKGACSTCHAVTKEYALFTDQRFHNTGMGWRNTMQPRPERQIIRAAPGTELDVERQRIDAVGQLERPNDLGRYEVTLNPADRWAFRTPSLRNVALTAPYMHDGSLSTLEDVIEFYDSGGHNHEHISPLLRPLNLEPAEKHALLAFLRALTGDNIEAVINDGRIGREASEHRQ
jgi:cytochrome c peroxidase